MVEKDLVKCPNCGSNKIVKKGKRRNKLQTCQQYQCKSCNHIFKQNPSKYKTNPVNQLTIYALASRTKLAVKDFKAAWFDEKNYFEFYPLHAVYGKKQGSVQK